VKVLRLTTAGSVDDGKSTLIGRLLYETKSVYHDHLDKVTDNTLADLADGLKSEREQGITIDVCYKYFSHQGRKFILSDAPGHVQYTRNMVTAASNADCAVILVDAMLGISEQTRRHLFILRDILKVPGLIFALNKIDLLDYDEKRIRIVEKAIAELEPGSLIVPVSALDGENVTSRSARTPWYQGPSLLEILMEAKAKPADQTPVYLPVQGVTRTRQILGTLRGEGNVILEDTLRILPSGETAEIESLYVKTDLAEKAGSGSPVALRLKREVDVGRGMILQKTSDPNPFQHTVEFTASVVWFNADAMQIGSRYLLHTENHQKPSGEIIGIEWVFDPATLEKKKCTSGTLSKNDIASLSLRSHAPVHVQKGTRFIVVDMQTNSTAAAGMVETITCDAQRVKADQTAVVLLTGLSGSGKTTVAKALSEHLQGRGKPSLVLDGDTLRDIFSNDDFSRESRVSHGKRLFKLARLIQSHHIMPIISIICPYREVRDFGRQMLGDAFKEIYVDTPLETCRERDVKGLYSRSSKGSVTGMTGVDSPYEEPASPDLRINSGELTVDMCVGKIMEIL